MPNSFRTARGRAQFEDGELRFVAGDGLGTLAAALTADSVPPWRRALVAVGLVAGLLGAAAVAAAATGPQRWLLLGGAAVVAVAGAVSRRRGRAADGGTVPLDAVEGVTIRRRLPGLSRPLVVIRYRDAGGVKHRHVRLPRGLYGFDAADRAREAFVHRGVAVDGP